MLSQRRINTLKEVIQKKTRERIHTEFDGVSVTNRKKACCVCDTQLDHRNNNIISVDALGERNWQTQEILSTSSLTSHEIKSFLKREYTIPSHRIPNQLSRANKQKLSKLIVSPRSVITFNQDKGCPMLSICCQCKEAKCRPKFSVFDIPTGQVPPILDSLNDVELALVSLGRISRHVFSVFGGAHKSIKTWHQIHVNNAAHIVGTLNFLEHAKVKPEIYCILSGAFTSQQKALAMERISIDRRKVIEAFKWLKTNNHYYKDEEVPDPTEIGKIVFIDNSHNEEAGDTNIESRHETTVFFPEICEIEETRGDFKTKEDFLQAVVAGRASDRLTLVSPSSKELVKTWTTGEFVKSFPLQFPFGLGCKPDKMSTLDYTRHLLTLSRNAFQRADFILVLANIHFKSMVVHKASIKCKYMSGNQTAVDRFNGIDTEEIDSLLDDPSQIFNEPFSNLSYFVKSVFAVAKVLPFTDEFIKDERMKLLSLCTQFGLPTGLLTITPDDSDNFNMFIYKMEDEEFLSRMDPPDEPGEDSGAREEKILDSIKKYLSDCESIRLNYPGYAEFEFENVMDIVIQDVFGWNAETCSSNPEGGLFGKLNAWFLAVEEQGRKTLHGHFLIWAKDWNEILKGVYSQNKEEATQGASKLTDFMKKTVSTSCFDIKIPVSRSSSHAREHYSPGDIALRHNCVDSNPTYVFPADQHLRYMRFRHCPDTPSHLQIARCLKCGKLFTLNDIKESSLSHIFNYKMKVECNRECHGALLRYVISISQSGIKNLETCVDKLQPEIKQFLIHFHRNLHSQRHTFTCFKKGSECRSRLPAKPSVSTTCVFISEQSIKWFLWTGEEQKRDPFFLTTERSELDAFTNQFCPFLSEIFHCNTNFQCGIDGAGIMYITNYACKSTRSDDKDGQLSILLALKLIMGIQNGNAGDNNNTATECPEAIGFKRLFTAAMANTSNYSLSAPMAKYLVLHGSRFRCSHTFSHLPLHDFIKGSTSHAKIEVSLRNKLFLSARRDTYLFRPSCLEDVDPMSFYSNYQVRTAHSSTVNNKDILHFHSIASSGYKNLCLAPLDIPTIPIVHFHQFENTACFLQDILDSRTETNNLVEEHCKKILLLFCSYRAEEDVQIESTFKKSLIKKIATGCINKRFRTIMQNMQDCQNSFDAKRLPDVLEQTTQILPEPAADASKHISKKTPAEVLKIIDQELSEVISEISESILSSGAADTNKYELSKLTGEGAWKIGKDEGLSPPKLPPGHNNLFIESSGEFVNPKKRNWEQAFIPISKPTRNQILKLQRQSTYRLTNLSNSDRQNTKNIRATGSCESIEAWAVAAFGKDENQKNAFKSLIADFVLQFLNDAVMDNSTKQQNAVIDNYDEQTSSSLRLWTNGLAEMRGVEGLAADRRVIMFLTGPGGSGKSHVIHNIMEYAKQYTEGIGHTFTSRTIVVTALTGVAATSILGETLHSATCINRKWSNGRNKSESGDNEKINQWKETKLIIVDEISFASQTIVKSMAKNVDHLKQNREERYGGISVCFAGDFSQLPPVTGTALYKDNKIDEWFYAINAYVELEGGHRFTDNNYKEMLDRLRGNKLTKHDFAALDKRVIQGKDLSIIPPGTQIACGNNKDRSAMNNLVFQGHLKNTHQLGGDAKSHTLVVKMSAMKWKSNKKEMTEKARHAVYEEAGDYNCTQGNDRNFVDPFLKLYIGAPVMLTKNIDVRNGIANGTVGRVKSVILKEGGCSKIEVINIDGYNVNSIEAMSVERIIIDIEQPDKSFREVSLEPAQQSAKVLMPIDCGHGISGKYHVDITGIQFTFLVNHATTVHKLQGRTVNSLYIVNWSYSLNWVYVALSRVRSLSGLYLRKSLDPLKNFAPHSQVKQMIDFFGTKKLSFRNSDYVTR